MKAHNKFAECALVSERFFYPIHFNSSVFHLAYQQNERTQTQKNCVQRLRSRTQQTHTHTHTYSDCDHYFRPFLYETGNTKKKIIYFHCFSNMLFCDYLFIHFNYQMLHPKNSNPNNAIPAFVVIHSPVYCLHVCVCLLLLLVSRLVFILYGFLVLPMVFRLMFFFFLCPPPFPPSFIPSPLC